jgi:hypothetical protein
MNNNNIIKIFCGVKYANKDECKALGGLWDSEKRSWYFKYTLDEFEENEDNHTHHFKPFSVSFENCKEYELKDRKGKYEFANTMFDIANNRTQKYNNQNTI